MYYWGAVGGAKEAARALLISFIGGAVAAFEVWGIKMAQDVGGIEMRRAVSEAFMQAFALSMMTLMVTSILGKYLGEKIAARLGADEKHREALFKALTGALTELAISIGKGTIFSRPWETLSSILINSLATYGQHRWGQDVFSARNNASEFSEYIYDQGLGFSLARIKNAAVGLLEYFWGG